MSSFSAAARGGGTSLLRLAPPPTQRRDVPGEPPAPPSSAGDTHDVGAGGAEGVGPADVEVGLVQRHEDADEVEAFGLQPGKSGDGAEHPSALCDPHDPPRRRLTSWLFFLKVHSEVFCAVGPHAICSGKGEAPKLLSQATTAQPEWGN